MKPAEPKYVYGFAEGSMEMRELLGGKGANIAEMARLGAPIKVPAGFTVTTEACVAYLAAGGPSPVDWRSRSTPPWLRSRSRRASGSATPPIRCSSPSARARASRCRG